MFRNLRVEKWRQIDVVDIDFHPRLTILTGANGAGKTTLLNLLSGHFGWDPQFVSIPQHSGATGVLRYFIGFWKGHKRKTDSQKKSSVGSITYRTGEQTELVAQSHDGPVYGIRIEAPLSVRGLHIPSHRPVHTYQSVTSIPMTPRTRESAFPQYLHATMTRMLGQSSTQSANYYMKETLLSLAALGFGNEVVARSEESVTMFHEFEQVLRAILPPQLGFQRIAVRIPEVVLETRSGDFSLDAVSGGIASILDIAWQIYMYAPRGTPFVVTIDEPENHLHPELQRTILLSMVEAFPQVQFIVASHSPFVVSSVADSNVYVLGYDSDKRVFSTLLDTVNKAGTSNEILRDVLGLSFTMPLWVESRLKSIVERYERQELTSASFTELRAEMIEIGLEKLIPEAIAQVVERSLVQ